MSRHSSQKIEMKKHKIIFCQWKKESQSRQKKVKVLVYKTLYEFQKFSIHTKFAYVHLYVAYMFCHTLIKNYVYTHACYCISFSWLFTCCCLFSSITLKLLKLKCLTLVSSKSCFCEHCKILFLSKMSENYVVNVLWDPHIISV